ncbi:MAG: hypothetical protein FJ050_11125 [Cyanobacteria bacterium M_surface_7_m2_040]|nr:hypothetical protein [Cyanobacteria bacterium M_surface_7_m2_040]
MSWDPGVLRKYNTTGHFRLLNQLRSELKANPLVRPAEGQTVGEANRSKALLRATEGRGRSAASRGGGGRRASAVPQSTAASAAKPETLTTDGPFTVVPLLSDDEAAASAAGFRNRLNAVDLR